MKILALLALAPLAALAAPRAVISDDATTLITRDRTCGAVTLGEQSCCAKDEEGSGLSYIVHLGIGWATIQGLCDYIDNSLNSTLGSNYCGSFSCQEDGETSLSVIDFCIEKHEFGAEINSCLSFLFPPPEINGFNCPSK